jgi:LmbE family N-acetylglucosaminyl deacetylase
MPERKTGLVVAAHPDDEVLGCGGTVAALVSRGWTMHALIMAQGATSRGEVGESDWHDALSELRECAAKAARCLGAQQPRMLVFPDNRMDSVDLLDVVKALEVVIEEIGPDRIFTHANCDVNVDHRVVHDAVIAATRPQPAHYRGDLYFFETVSSTEWRPPSSLRPFSPTAFCDISDHLPAKMDALRAYAPEMREYPHARSLEAVANLAYVRGASVGLRAAEAFETGRQFIQG